MKRVLLLLFALFVVLTVSAYTYDDFVWDFRWTESSNRITIAVGEEHQLQYKTSTNYSKVFLNSMSSNWVHIVFAGMQHVVDNPDGYTISEKGVILGLKVGSYAIYPTGLIQPADGADKWLYITVVSVKEETEPNNTMESASELNTRIKCGLYNSTDIDYFRHKHNLSVGKYVTFKVHYTGYRDSPFGYRWATFSNGMMVGSGSLLEQDQECDALVLNRDDVYLEIYFNQSLSQYFNTGETFQIEVYEDGEPVSKINIFSIKAVGEGVVTYNGKSIRGSTETGVLERGASATLSFSPDDGYRLASLIVNGKEVISTLNSDTYTLNDIKTETNVIAAFEAIPSDYYSLTIQSKGCGRVSFNDTIVESSKRVFILPKESEVRLFIKPDKYHKVDNLTVNSNNVTSKIVDNYYLISSLSGNTSVVVTFSEVTCELSVKASGNGIITYDGTTVKNTTHVFSANQGSSATFTLTADQDSRIEYLRVNNTDVTSKIKNHQYIINEILENTFVEVTFKSLPQSIPIDGINYKIIAYDEKTMNVNFGSYSAHVTIPASITYEGEPWSVRGVVPGAFDIPNITAITWNPNYIISSDAFGKNTNPNMLLYVKSTSYAPSNVQNVVANGKAKRIVLTDAASGNDFYCPEEFTATELTYTHKYTMSTGINECRGWETIALPFKVHSIVHETKGNLVPFKVYSGKNLPFWLYEWSASGFVEASAIEANTPYIISFPNNDYYYKDYNLSGNISFLSDNVRVFKSSELKGVNGKDKMFVPNYSTLEASTHIYPLNVQNDYNTHSDYYLEGSTFVQELRTVHPFEAYMTTNAANAKGFIPIFETQPTAIREIPMQGVKGVRIYSLSGELIMFDENISIEEALKRLKRGVYFVNGKKMVVSK